MEKDDDRLRSSVLYKDEALKVIYHGDALNIKKDVILNAYSRFCMPSHLPYPQPKWIACSYYIIDDDGDHYFVAYDRYGKLEKGFEWVKDI